MQTQQLPELKPPSGLSTEEQWIVRLQGKDMGPFSSAEIYPLLLKGEIEPQTLLLDQNSFQRFRLQDREEFIPYLSLHNTHNPILLEEQKQQEKDEHWEKKGRRRLILGVSLVVLLIVGGVSYWYFVYSKKGDAFIASGDYKFSVASPFKTIKDRKERDWSKYRPKYVRRRKKAKKGPAGAVIDFTADGGSAIPYKKLQNIVRRRISAVFGCFKAQHERDRSFDGGVLKFSIHGKTGKVSRVALEKGDAGRILLGCVRRRSRGWTFPLFPGNAAVFFPLWISRR